MLVRIEIGGNNARAEPLQTDRLLPFAVALGHQLRRAREDRGTTGAEVAHRSRFVGLYWDRSTVTRIELGQRQLTAAELLLLPVLYERSVADLLPAEPCRLNDQVCAKPEVLRTVLTRQVPWGLVYGSEFWEAFDKTKVTVRAFSENARKLFPNVPDWTALDAAEHASDETTVKAARKLAGKPWDVAVAAELTFGRSLADERDARVGDKPGEPMRTRQARRGHVTRRLLEEIRPAFDAIVAARDDEEKPTDAKR